MPAAPSSPQSGPRALAALLTVLAALAFPLRASWPSVSVLEGHHPAHEQPHAGEHAAHCLFCLTGAFATEAAPPPALPAPARLFGDGPRLTLSPAAARLPLPGARAPPLGR